MASPGPEHHDRQSAPQNVSPVKARQGLLGFPVLVVLVAALLLAMIVWWGVEMFGGSITPPQEEQVGDPATVEPLDPAQPSN